MNTQSTDSDGLNLDHQCIVKSVSIDNTVCIAGIIDSANLYWHWQLIQTVPMTMDTMTMCVDSIGE